MIRLEGELQLTQETVKTSQKEHEIEMEKLQQELENKRAEAFPSQFRALSVMSSQFPVSVAVHPPNGSFLFPAPTFRNTEELHACEKQIIERKFHKGLLSLRR